MGEGRGGSEARAKMEDEDKMRKKSESGHRLRVRPVTRQQRDRQTRTNTSTRHPRHAISPVLRTLGSALPTPANAHRRLPCAMPSAKQHAFLDRPRPYIVIKQHPPSAQSPSQLAPPLERGQHRPLRDPRRPTSVHTHTTSTIKNAYPPCSTFDGVSFAPSTATRSSTGTYSRFDAPTYT